MKEDSPEKLVTVAAFSLPIEAQLARLRLESHGVECRIDDENIISINWLYSDAIGGVKLKVRESDAERAREVLESEGEDFSAEGPIEYDMDEGPGCPVCGSTRSMPRGFLSRFASEFELPVKRERECLRCGHAFKH
jgi:hypothetical protein